MTTTAPLSSSTSLPSPLNKLSTGYYIFFAVILGITTADTKIGPWVGGVLAVGLIFQINALFKKG